MTVDEARASIGRGVVYERPYTPKERGIIMAVHEQGTVFVRYDGDLYPKGTNAEDLTLEVAR